MNLSVFFPVKKAPPSIGALQLDAALSENHRYENEVTSFPVETGASITDHIFNRPITLSITGFVTNSPITIVTNVSKQVSFTSVGADPVRTQTAYDALMTIWKERTLIDIITPLSSYKDMALVSLSIPRNADIGDTLRFDAEFRQVKIVSTLTVSAENLALNTSGAKAGSKELASKTQNNGNQNTTETDKGSALYRVFVR